MRESCSSRFPIYPAPSLLSPGDGCADPVFIRIGPRKDNRRATSLDSRKAAGVPNTRLPDGNRLLSVTARAHLPRANHASQVRRVLDPCRDSTARLECDDIDAPNGVSLIDLRRRSERLSAVF